MEFETREERKRPWQTFSGGLGCGCLTFLVVGAIVLGPTIYRARKSPEFRCQANLTAIGGAMMKFREEHSRYPNTLDELTPKYIKQDKVFYCPLTEGARESRRYDYQPPTATTKPYEPVIICRRHKDVVLALLANGMATGWQKKLERATTPKEEP